MAQKVDVMSGLAAQLSALQEKEVEWATAMRQMERRSAEQDNEIRQLRAANARLNALLDARSPASSASASASEGEGDGEDPPGEASVPPWTNDDSRSGRALSPASSSGCSSSDEGHNLATGLFFKQIGLTRTTIVNSVDPAPPLTLTSALPKPKTTKSRPAAVANVGPTPATGFPFKKASKIRAGSRHVQCRSEASEVNPVDSESAPSDALSVDGSLSTDRSARLSKSLLDAAWNGHADEVRRLLREGADLTAKDPFVGYTALHRAAAYGRTQVVKLLVEEGAPMEARDVFGRTALHFAARWGRAACAEALAAAGADLEAADADGNTPLHRAAMYGRGACVRTLLRAGADAGAQNSFGETPRDVAGEDPVAELLPSIDDSEK